MMKSQYITLIIMISLTLSGCSSSVDSDVVEFVKKTKNQKSDRAGDLPEFPHPVKFKYKASNLRNPFEPFTTSTTETKIIRAEGGPDLNRSREPLENYAIDTLHMVGTLERDGQFYALLKDASGIIHRVSVGNYIGQNSGKIEKINETELQAREWLVDTKGGWKEHMATLELVKPTQ
jgi:type IV pilus assembly protein PilP